MAYPSVTNTFSSGTTAIASQWNTNFTDIINGLSDGTKDSQIKNLNAAGTLSVTGDLYTKGWTDYSSVSITGMNYTSWKYMYYKKIGKTVTIDYYIGGSGFSLGYIYFTLPYTSFVNSAYLRWSPIIVSVDGTYSVGWISLGNVSAFIYRNFIDGWSGITSMESSGSFTYEATS